MIVDWAIISMAIIITLRVRRSGVIGLVGRSWVVDWSRIVGRSGFICMRLVVNRR